jgi:hypothetical protein
MGQGDIGLRRRSVSWHDRPQIAGVQSAAVQSFANLQQQTVMAVGGSGVSLSAISRCRVAKRMYLPVVTGPRATGLAWMRGGMLEGGC